VTIYNVAGRRILIHDREEWQLPSRPVTGPTPLPDLVHHAVIHWPGASAGWIPPLDTAAHLRWSHDLYLRDRGYSYGYGFVVGQNKINWDADPIVFDLWEVRGFDIRIASNDGDNGWYGTVTNPGFNGRSISLQLVASEVRPATPDQILQARYWVTLCDQRFQEQLQVIPHRVSDATSCPGNYIAGRMDEIDNRITVAPPPPPPPPAGVWVDVILGQTGDRVKQVQYALTSKGFAPYGGVDGVYGLHTAAKVGDFQLSRSLPLRNTVVDIATAVALGFDVAPPPPPPPPPPAGPTYTVVSGDSWYRISYKLGVRAGVLAAANGATFDSPVRVGDVLKVPPPQRSYTVQSNDGMWRVATELQLPATDATYSQLALQLQYKYGRAGLRVGDVFTA
jgi:LysM repeat protein